MNSCHGNYILQWDGGTLLGVTVTVLVLMENNAERPPLSHALCLLLPLSPSNSSLKQPPSFATIALIFLLSHPPSFSLPLPSHPPYSSLPVLFLCSCPSPSCLSQSIPPGDGCSSAQFSLNPHFQLLKKQSCEIRGSDSGWGHWGSWEQRERERFWQQAEPWFQ